MKSLFSQLIKDSAVSDEKYAEAILLGEWITAEVNGNEETVCYLDGRIYFTDPRMGSMEFTL